MCAMTNVRPVFAMQIDSFINNFQILFKYSSVCTFLSSLLQWCMNVESHNEICIMCFEQLYLMIVLTTKQWNYGYLVCGPGDLK